MSALQLFTAAANWGRTLTADPLFMNILHALSITATSILITFHLNSVRIKMLFEYSIVAVVLITND